MSNNALVKRYSETTFDVFPLRLGASSWPPMSENDIGFYSNLCEFLGLPDSEYLGDRDRPSIAITTEELREAPEKIPAAIGEAASQIDPTADVVYFDVSTIRMRGGASWATLDPSVDQYVSVGVRQYLESRDGTQCKVFVMLLPALPQSAVASRVTLNELIEVGRVVLIGDNGDCTREEFPSTQYASLISQVRGAPIRLLEEKIVERRGWFRQSGPGTPIRYTRSFFDCEHAGRELERLLVEQLGDSSSSRKPQVVLYRGGSSPWLRDPLSAACVTLHLDRPYDLDRHGDVGRLRQHVKWRNRRAALVMPYVDSLETSRESIQEAEGLVSLSVERVVAVLSCKGAAVELGSRAVDRPGGRSVPLTYLRRVTQEYVLSDEPNCYPSALGVPESDFRAMSLGALSAYEFWDLVTDPGVGAIEEKHVPADHRVSVGLVPDFARMVDRHGKWLANRLWTIVEPLMLPAAGKSYSHPSSAIFVIPEAEDTSQRLADQMVRTIGVRVVAIPRSDIAEAIDFLKAPDGDLDPIWRRRPDWSRELLGASARSKVCILDDFVVSGETINALTRIVEYSGPSGRSQALTVLAACCIVDFSPEQREGRVLALYEWQRPPADREE